MGRLVLAGAIEGLGAGLGKAAEQRGKMAQEAERTARDITLQRMRDKAAMERTGEQETGLSDRLQARYGEGGFEEAMQAVKHTNTMEEIAERGKYQVQAAQTTRDRDVQTVEYQTYDADGFPLGKKMTTVNKDPETGMAMAQVTKSGVTLNVPVSMLEEGAQGPPKSKEAILWKSPHHWERYEKEFGELPAWFNTYFYKFKEGRRKKKPTPTPTPGPGQNIAARGTVQRDGAGGGGGTEPVPDLKERLLTRASEMQ